MRDFLGQQIEPGLWLAFPGNSKDGEYGQVVLYVTKVSKNQIYVQRLATKMSYDRKTHQRANKAYVDDKVVRNTRKCVVIDPPLLIKQLFATTVAGELDFDQQYMIAEWLTGQETPQILAS
jgi:hypothetical protein